MGAAGFRFLKFLGFVGSVIALVAGSRRVGSVSSCMYIVQPRVSHRQPISPPNVHFQLATAPAQVPTIVQLQPATAPVLYSSYIHINNININTRLQCHSCNIHIIVLIVVMNE